jgi:DNA-binding NtrC family response regulator
VRRGDAEAQEHRTGTPSTRTVLVAGDDLDLVDDLRRSLPPGEYRLETAGGADQAAGRAQKKDIAVVVVALARPRDWAGVAAVRRADTQVPIVTVTSSDSLEGQRMIRREGVFFHFVKPLAPDDMRVVIDSAARVRQAAPHGLHRAKGRPSSETD